MDDLIDRQAVMDAIQKLNIPEDMCVFEIMSHIEVEIAALPSVQSEIIRCRECMHYDADNFQCETDKPHSGTWFPESYCDRAERKEE